MQTSTSINSAGLMLSYEQSADLVVNGLRAGLPPESLHKLLKEYAQSNAFAPVIYTNRNKILFIEYEPIEDLITLYVGDSALCERVGRENAKAYCTMPLEEKYVLKHSPMVGFTLKRVVLRETKVLLFTVYARNSKNVATCVGVNADVQPVHENEVYGITEEVSSPTVSVKNVLSVFSLRKSRAGKNCA